MYYYIFILVLLLLSFLRNHIEVISSMASIRGGEILPELCLYCCLRYLAGGSYTDIMFFTGISAASGHYQAYGVNVQAACDHHCQFTFIGVAGPGVMGD